MDQIRAEVKNRVKKLVVKELLQKYKKIHIRYADFNNCSCYCCLYRRKEFYKQSWRDRNLRPNFRVQDHEQSG